MAVTFINPFLGAAGGTSGTLISRVGWTASGTEDFTGSEFAKALDGNAATRWGYPHAPTPGSTYFAVDLGSAQLVGGFMVDSSAFTTDVPTAGDVQWSDTSATGPWTTIASWTASGGSISSYKQSWTPASHRYWRLLAQATCNGGGFWSIGEFYLYSDAAPP